MPYHQRVMVSAGVCEELPVVVAQWTMVALQKQSRDPGFRQRAHWNLQPRSN